MFMVSKWPPFKDTKLGCFLFDKFPMKYCRHAADDERIAALLVEGGNSHAIPH